MVLWIKFVPTFMSTKSSNKILKQMDIIIIILLLLHSHGLAASTDDDLSYPHLKYDCPKSGFPYSLGSEFHENLNHTLFTQFLAIAPQKNSSDFTIGEGINQVYALYYCRGDVDANVCNRCIQSAVKKIFEVCKLLKQGIIWYEFCTLRYANHSIFSLDEVNPMHLHYNRTSLVSEYHLDPYKIDFHNSMKNLINQVAYNGSLHGFSMREINLSTSQTLRGLAQCTPFVRPPFCEKCLEAALKKMDVWYVTMALLPSCLLRYDLYGLPPTPPPSPNEEGSTTLPVRYQVLIAVFSVFAIILLIGGIWFWRRRCSKGTNSTDATQVEINNTEVEEVNKNVTEVNKVNTNISEAREVDTDIKEANKIQGFKQFTYSQVEHMTGNFQKKLGEGGYGVVFYGCLENGREVAVKMQSKSGAPKQYGNEIEVLGRISHKNLVSLFGYCEEGAFLALIYEYMPRGDLKVLLSENSSEHLSWHKRLEIAFDTAQGLEYLHNFCSPPIVHRDVKPANILLNEHLQAKVADFGHSRIFPEEVVSRISASIVGTPGYIDPQYYSTGLLNEKSDVYGFGIVLLELITGQNVLLRTGTSLVQWVKTLIDRGDIGSILDPKLRVDVGENYSSVWRATELAKRCAEFDGNDRPTMTEIVIELRECLVLVSMDTASSSSAPTTIEMMSAAISTSSMFPRPR